MTTLPPLTLLLRTEKMKREPASHFFIYLVNMRKKERYRSSQPSSHLPTPSILYSASKPLPNPPLPICHRLKSHIPPPTPHHLHAPRINPPAQILALANIKQFQIPTPLDNSFDARARDAHAAAHRQVAEFKKVQGDAAEGSVGDCGTAESEVEVCERGETEGQNFCCCVAEGAAERLSWTISMLPL